MILLAYSATVIPYQLAFIEDDSVFYIMDWIVDFLYIIDIILTFFTAFENEKLKMEIRLSKIAKAYI